jgi:hypothetical protein
MEAVSPVAGAGARLDADPGELRPITLLPAESGDAATRAVTNCDRRQPAFIAPMAPNAESARFR